MTYVPGSQPDPEFTAFFAGEWQQLLERVEIPGVENPAWDRRAAYLIWILGNTLQDAYNGMAMDGGLGEQDTIPTGEFLLGEFFPAPINWAQVLAVPTVGVNHDEDDDCEPTPGGVPLAFDSSKHSGDTNG